VYTYARIKTLVETHVCLTVTAVTLDMRTWLYSCVYVCNLNLTETIFSAAACV
jgi:hypothetical protein